MTVWDDLAAAVSAARADGDELLAAARADAELLRVQLVAETATLDATRATLGEVRALHEQTRGELAAALARIVVLEEQLAALQPPVVRRLGWYNGGPAADVSFALGGTPQIASTYYQPDQAGLNLEAEIARIKRGTSPLITLTLKSGPATLADVATQTPAAIALLDTYTNALQQLAEVDPGVPVYATLDHEAEVKINQGTLPGVTATVYAKALSVFLDRCTTRAPAVRSVYWYGASDRTKIAQVLAGLTTPPDVICMDPYSTRSHPGTETFTETIKPHLDWLRSNPDYTRLGSPPVGLGEFGTDIAHGDPSCAAWLTDLRARLVDLDLLFALLFNRDSTGWRYKITSGGTPASVTAFNRSITQTP